jgi:hypothetical protein
MLDPVTIADTYGASDGREVCAKRANKSAHMACRIQI